MHCAQVLKTLLLKSLNAGPWHSDQNLEAWISTKLQHDDACASSMQYQHHWSNAVSMSAFDSSFFVDVLPCCCQQGITYCGLNMDCLLLGPDLNHLMLRLGNFLMSSHDRWQHQKVATNEAACMSPDMLLTGLSSNNIRACRSARAQAVVKCIG